jgi:hypothetical protein
VSLLPTETREKREKCANTAVMKTQSTHHALLLSLVLALTFVSPARASIDSLWSSPATVGAKGSLALPGSSRVDYLYALDSAAALCRIYNPDNFTQTYSFPLSSGTYTYLWYSYLNDVNGNGHPEAIVYKYSTATYCYSVSIIDMFTGSVLKSWSSASYSYFPKFIGATSGSSALKLGIEKSTGTASAYPSVLLVYSLGITAAVGGDPAAPPTVPGILLEQSVPNPAADKALIEFTLPNPGRATLTIYNQLGQEVRRLVDSELGAGSHRVLFDAGGLANGAYFYRLQTQDGQDVKKLVLIK